MQRVLVIDDSEIVLAMMEGMLSSAGWEVRTAGGGQEGLSLLETFPAELVICDLRMPGMDGIEVARRVRARWPLLPLLILTDHAEVSQVVTAMREGAYGYILKGSAEDMLLTETRGALEHGRLLEKNRHLEEANTAYQRHLEAMVTQKTEENLKLQRVKSQAEKMGALNNLVAGLAHEVNNPLAVVKSSLSWALELSREVAGERQGPGPHALSLDEVTAGELDELPSVMQEAIDSADRIARTIKTLRRLIQPKAPGASSSLEAVLRKCERSWEAVRPPGVVLEASSVTGLPRACLGEEDLSCVLDQLVRNALLAISGKAGLVSVRARATAEGGLELEVKDNGVGIPPEHLARLCDPFFTTREPGAGAGLGLSVVQHLVHSCGGELRFQSVPKEGTLVSVLLPSPTSHEASPPAEVAMGRFYL